MGYDLDQFFRVKSKVELLNGVTCYLRTLADWEVRERQDRAILASKKRRDELRDPESELYKTYIEVIEFTTDEDLRRSIVLLETREIARQALEEIQPRYIAFPDDASLKEKHEVLEKREKEEQGARKKRDKVIKSRVKALEKTLAKKKREYLLGRMKAAQESARVLQAFVVAFDRLTIYYCCFKDKARETRFFKTPEDVGQLTQAIINFLLDEYGKIDGASIRQLQDFFETEPSSEPQES